MSYRTRITAAAETAGLPVTANDTGDTITITAEGPHRLAVMFADDGTITEAVRIDASSRPRIITECLRLSIIVGWIERHTVQPPTPGPTTFTDPFDLIPLDFADAR